jgi:hypothetical protein
MDEYTRKESYGIMWTIEGFEVTEDSVCTDFNRILAEAIEGFLVRLSQIP